MRSLFCPLVAFLISGQALAADLTVRVTSGNGAPIEDAVITFTPASSVQTPIRFNWAYQVVQQNLKFKPYILIVPTGATVSFPNLDSVRHHVYSFSEGNRFELDLFGRNTTRSHRFTRVGIAAIGCNIHDQMQAYIVIVDTPHVGRTAKSGSVVISGVSGNGVLRVWHPDLRARGGSISRSINVPASGPASETFAIQLRAGSHAH